MTEQRGSMARFTFRTIASIVGLIGTVIALVIAVLYSLAHVLGRVAGVSTDISHFWGSLFIVLVGAVGAFMAPLQPILAAIMLFGAGIAFFFAVGWWAIIASPFLIVAGLLTFSNRRVSLPGTA